MADPVLPAGHRPASVEEIISALAAKESVPPYLALAVARKESGTKINQNAVGDGGLALGAFQLHAGAAQDVNVDRTDPMGNLQGGVKYLKLLSDRYKGDPMKVLMAYNGGMDNVDKGTISPAAQAYASAVMADVTSLASQAKRTSGGRASGAGPVGTTVNPSAPGEITPAPTPPTVGSMASQALGFIDPRTPSGRENILGAGVSIGAGMLAPESWILRALYGTAGAAVGGGTSAAIDRAIGQPTDTTIPGAAARQATMNAVGETMALPIVGALKIAVAPRIARTAEGVLSGRVATAKAAGEAMVQSVKDDVRATSLILKRATRSTLRSVKETTKSLVQGTERFAAGMVGDTEGAAANALADTELKAARQASDLEAQYAALQPPDPMAVHGDVASTLGGRPGLLRIPDGPVKRGIDIAGQAVQETADSGPVVRMQSVIDTLGKATRRAKPGTIFQPKQTTPGIGFVQNSRSAGAAATNWLEQSQQRFAKLITDQLALPAEERLPLSGILKLVAEAPEEIPFRDAHALKGLLDERVNWDKTARTVNERLTKFTRSALRREMRYEPYDEANATYAALMDLNNKGIGKTLLTAAATNPDKVVQILDSKNPIAATTLKTLLVGQAAAGGDAAMGQRAWNGLVASHGYNTLIRGGINGLADRVEQLVSEHPQFVHAVYGDGPGLAFLDNLRELGQAAKTGKELAKESIAGAKATGATNVLKATTAGERTVADARVLAEREKANVREVVLRRLEDAKEAARQRVATASGVADQGIGAAKAGVERLRQSSLGPHIRSADSERADLARVAVAGVVHSRWGLLSAVRLLDHPVYSKDLIEYVSHSTPLTKLWVNVLTGQAPKEVATGVIRGAYSTIFPLMPSHEQASKDPDNLLVHQATAEAP